jgi:heme/copper-type cytochrome/quinol oxidase subunit 1
MTSCATGSISSAGSRSSSRFAFNTGADAGWFAYVPLTGPQYGIGRARRFLECADHLHRGDGLMVAVDIATTILKKRAPGMSFAELPMFAWASLVTAIMIIFAMPTVMLAANLVQLDRMVDTHFFNPRRRRRAAVAAPVLVFRPPEVYFIFVPALGFISEIIPTFARGRCSATTPSSCRSSRPASCRSGCGCITCSRPNLPELGKSFFTAMSFVIAIPTAIQIFCWIATLATGAQSAHAAAVCARLLRHPADRRLTGLMLGSVPLDLQVHDTVLRRRAPALRADRRRRCSRCSRDLLLVPEDDGPHARRALGAGSSGCCSPASTSRSFRCTSSACRGCRARIYTYPRRWGGERSISWRRSAQ